MDIEQFRAYCLQKKGVEESLPFDANTLCFKVAGKIFAITDIEHFESINLKSTPEYAVELREMHPEIIPGYHMNKKHWNTVSMVGALSNDFIVSLIDLSYNLVVEKLPKQVKQSLE
ncbi:MAG: MmcQ/YjbR family DNA-binding protein [Luteibaculaceae bacterium]